jgi:hypothetical protein
MYCLNDEMRSLSEDEPFFAEAVVAADFDAACGFGVLEVVFFVFVVLVAMPAHPFVCETAPEKRRARPTPACWAYAVVERGGDAHRQRVLAGGAFDRGTIGRTKGGHDPCNMVTFDHRSTATPLEIQVLDNSGRRFYPSYP